MSVKAQKIRPQHFGLSVPMQPKKQTSYPAIKLLFSSLFTWASKAKHHRGAILLMRRLYFCAHGRLSSQALMDPIQDIYLRTTFTDFFSFATIMDLSKYIQRDNQGNTCKTFYCPVLDLQIDFSSQVILFKKSKVKNALSVIYIALLSIRINQQY